MANRTMQAKSLKLKRQRRLFPKQYCSDYIAVGGGPNREVMGEYKERSKSLAFDAKYLEFLEAHARFKNVPPGKHEANVRLAKMKLEDYSLTWQRIQEAAPNLQHVVLIHKLHKRVSMYYNQERTQFILWEEDFAHCTARASIRYQSRERLLERLRNDDVKWVGFVSSPSTTST